MPCKSKHRQAFNRRTGAWVEFKLEDIDHDGDLDFVPVNVKQRNPKVPFKGIPIVGKHRRK